MTVELLLVSETNESVFFSGQKLLNVLLIAKETVIHVF